MSESLLAVAGAAWSATGTAQKLAHMQVLAEALPCPGSRIGECTGLVDSAEPGRPQQPVLIGQAGVPRRGLGSRQGRAAFFHALAHIEFTAINLALDAALRYPGLPEAYYRDWLGVAVEEAGHFRLLQGHVGTLDCSYGALPAHSGLWEVAAASAGQVLHRMALVPRVLEARGLDVSPPMIARLLAVGDTAGAAILQRILADEVGHVAIGSRWFHWLCGERGLRPGATFLGIVREHFRGSIRGPLNLEARRQAGFSEEELEALERPAS